MQGFEKITGIFSRDSVRRTIASILVAAECFSVAASGASAAYAQELTAPELILSDQAGETVQPAETWETSAQPATVTPAEAARLAAEAAAHYADEAESAAAEAEQAADGTEVILSVGEMSDAVLETAAQASARASEAAGRAHEAAALAADEAVWAAQAVEIAAAEADRTAEEAARAAEDARIAAQTAEQEAEAARIAEQAEAVAAESAREKEALEYLQEVTEESATKRTEPRKKNPEATEKPTIEVIVLEDEAADPEKALDRTLSPKETEPAAADKKEDKVTSEAAEPESEEAAWAAENAARMAEEYDRAYAAALQTVEEAKRAYAASDRAEQAAKRAAEAVTAAAQKLEETKAALESAADETASEEADAETPEKAPSEEGDAETPEKAPSEEADAETPEKAPSEEGDAETPEKAPSEEGDAETPEKEPSEETDAETPEKAPSEEADAETPEKAPSEEADAETPEKAPSEEAEPAQAEEQAELPQTGVLSYASDAVSLQGEAPLGVNVVTADVMDRYRDFDPNTAVYQTSDSAAFRSDEADAPHSVDTVFTVLAAYDISLSLNGEEYQPEAGLPLAVTITDPAIEEGLALQVWHIHDDGAPEQITDFTVEGHGVRFMAESFSAYLVGAYTVDFHWGDYTYSIAGESEITLSALLEKLGVTEITAADVAEVAFSDPALVEVETIKNEAEQTTDWLLRSLAPFNTEETLTLTLKNGETVTIKVTDAVTLPVGPITWENGNGTWAIDESGVMTVSGTGAMDNYESGVDSTPWVNYIKGAAAPVTKIIFSGDITSIGKNTFTRSYNVVEIDASNCSSLQKIGGSAFKQSSGGNTKNPKIVNFSGCINLTTIDEQGFRDCKGIEELDISGTKLNADYITTSAAGFVSSKTSLKVLKANGCTTNFTTLDLTGWNKLETVELSGCTNLTSLTLPSNVTTLDVSGCTSMTSLTVPSNVTTLDVSGCTGLTGLTVPSKVTTLNVSGCTGLTSLDLSGCASLTELDASDCASLTSLTVPSGVTTLNVSGCTGLTTLDASACTGLTTLNVSGCTGLTSLSVPNGITTLDISGCTGLDSLDLSSYAALTTVKVGNRSDLDNLSWLTLPASVTTLDASGFTSLTSLDTVPASVTSLNISGCTGLTALDLSETSLTNIDVSDNSSLTILKLPASVTSLDVSECPNLVIYFDGKAEDLPELPDSASIISWGDYTYTIARKGTATLEEIFTALGITAIDTTDIQSISASDPSVLEITDMTVKSLKTFTEPQTLTVMLTNGMSGTIIIACETLEESENLNLFLDSNTVYSYEGETDTHPLSESAILKTGDVLNLNLTLSFSEIPEGEEGERQMKLLGTMKYTFPAGLTVSVPATVDINVQSGEQTLTFTADVAFNSETGVLTLTGNYGDQAAAVSAATAVSFTIPVSVQVSTVPHDYELADSLTLSAVKSHNVKVNSFTAGDYNAETGTFTYTAVVEAENDLDFDGNEYLVSISDLTTGAVSGTYTYAHKDGFALSEGAPASQVNGVDVEPGVATAFTAFPLTVAHMYEGDRITLTYTAKPQHGSYNRDTQTTTAQNTLTITNNDAGAQPNPSNILDDDTVTVTTDVPYSPITREFLGLEGSWASWKVTVNPKGYTLNGGSSSFILADTFDDDYPTKETKTDAGQSIDYNSINVDSGSEISYDYSGNTGTFVIPDNTAVTITYRTRITAQPGEKKHFRGTAVLKTGKEADAAEIARSTAGVTEETPGYEDGMAIYPSASDVAGFGTNYMVKLYVYADGQMQTGVNGVQFILLDANQRAMEYAPGNPVTFTTTTTDDGSGYAIIELDESSGISIEKNTAYYLEMIQAPAGYQKDNTLYIFMITDDPSYNSGGIYTYYNGDTMKVRLYAATPGLKVSIRFSGSYALREDQQNNVEAVLQHQVEGKWEDVERHYVSEAKWGTITFTTQLSTFDAYRVIEENEKPWDLPEQINVVTKYYCMVGGSEAKPETTPQLFNIQSGSDSVNVVIDNRYEESQLTLVKMNKKTGELLSGAKFSVFRIENGAAVGDPVTTYTTDNNGELVIRGGDTYQAYILYGIVETKAPEGYLLPQDGHEEWHYFYFCNDDLLEPTIRANLPKGKTAVNLTNSGDRITVGNQQELLTIPVMVLWQGNTWPVNVQKVTIGLYQSVNGETPTAVEDKSGNPLTVELSSAAPYNNDAFKDLPSRDEQERNITYSIKEEKINDIAPLEARYVQEYGVSDAGVYVVRNRKATSLTITKEWYNPDGSRITKSDELKKQPTVIFDVYRSNDFDLPEEGSEVVTSEQMSNRVNLAEKVRSGLTLDNSNVWTYTIDDLELVDDSGYPYRYYVLETVPFFGDETYKIEYRYLGDAVFNTESVAIQNTVKSETATLTVEKAPLVDDPRPESQERAFEFTLKLQTKQANDSHPIRYWTVNPDNDLETDWDGEVKFYLKPTKSIALTLPVGTTATITETLDPEYTVQTSTGGETLNSRTFSYEVTSESSTSLTYINTLRAVCKVQPTEGDPVIFESLKSALAYIRSHDVPRTIYMLEDYIIPSTDGINLTEGESLTLTTASTDDPMFHFKGGEEADRAVITRGGVGGSILKNAGTLTLEKIVLDGAKDSYTVTENGGLVNSTGTLNLNDKAVLRNSATDGEGGAIWSSGTVNIVTGVQITGNSAPHGSAIWLDGGALNISGGSITDNSDAEDGAVVAGNSEVRVYPTGTPVINRNTNIDNQAANLYINSNSNQIITVENPGLGIGAQIGVTAFPGHMEIGEQFATAAYGLDDSAKATLNCFFNDTYGYLGKVGEGSPTSIVWNGLTVEIHKIYKGIGGNPDDSFDITLTSPVIRKGNYTILGNYDYSIVPGRQGMQGKIILHQVKADDEISISPLPAGIYTVAENKSNYTPAFFWNNEQSENGEFTLQESGIFTVENTRKLAKANLTKTLDDRLEGENPVPFGFDIKLTEADGTPVKGFALYTDEENHANNIETDTNGVATFTMSPSNETDAVREFVAPVGATMTITETENSKYRITASALTMPEEMEGAVIEDGDTEHDNVFVISTVTNDGADVKFENVRKMARIDLTKELTGKVSSNDYFEFEVTLENAVNYDMSADADGSIKTDEDGKAVIRIAFEKSEAASTELAQTVHSKSVTLVIPEGTNLKVEETDANGHNEYYNTTVSRNGESATQTSSLTIPVTENDNSIVFRNERRMQTVTVTNTVGGYAGNLEPFTYTASVTDWVSTEEKPVGYDDYDDYGFTDGQMIFELTNGQSRELRVPYGVTLTVTEDFIVGYETSVNGVTAEDGEPASDSFTVETNKTVAFVNTQLINLVLVNNTSADINGITVKIDYATKMFRVNDDKTAHSAVALTNHAATISVRSGETAILEVDHVAPQGKKIEEYEDPYTVSGTISTPGYYYTINNEPSFHEFADPAYVHFYNTGSFTLKGKLRYSVTDSTITFTEQPLVSFDVNGGAWTTEMEGYHDRDGDRKVYQKAVAANGVVAEPTPDPIYPTAEGITFLGWTRDEGYAKQDHSSETEIDPGKAYNFETATVTAPITLCAVWAKPAREERVVTVKNGYNTELTVNATLTRNNTPVSGYAITDELTTGTDGKARFTLTAGESKNLSVPDGAKLVLSLENASLAVSSEYTLAASAGNTSYTINSVKRDGTVTFIPGVCKITDVDGNILYTGKDENGETVYAPAVFGKLSDAFTAYVGTLYKKTGETTWQDGATPAYVKMLVDEYEISEKHEFPNASMTLTTAGKDDARFPYTGTRERATIIRASGFKDTCFVMSEGNITIKKIILDSGSSLGRKADPPNIRYTFYTTEKVSNVDTEMTRNVYGGSLIVISDGNMTVAEGTTLRNGEFTAYTNNKSGTIYTEKADGTVLVTGGTLTVNAGRFENLNARSGGAICVVSEGQLALAGSDICFENCTASAGHGGAIYYRNSSNQPLTINGGTNKAAPGIVFNACVGKNYGGAIYAATSHTPNIPTSDLVKDDTWDGPLVTVSGCSFTECSAKTGETNNAGNGGGAICANGVNGLTVSYCTFLSCDTMSRGGAIVAAVENGGTVSVDNSTFESCNCKGQGGGIAVYQPNQEGGIPKETDARAKTKLSVNSCDFSNCSSGTNNGSGGAIQCYLPCMEYTDSTFTDCWAGKEGGAINNYFGNGYTAVWPGTYMNMTGCTFIRCRAENRYQPEQPQHYGGGINTKVKTVTVRDSRFEDCVSTLREGGALHLGGQGGGSKATITGSTFKNCMAKTGGGAVLASTETLDVSGSFFYGCQAFGEPAANYVYNNNNKKNQNGGGAISHSENSRGTSTQKTTLITNCVFSADPNGGTDALSCSTATNGGAIWTRASTNVTLNNLTIENAIAGNNGGGIYLDAGVTKATITDGSTTGCQAVNGSAVYVGKTATFSGNLKVSGNICTNSDSGAIQTVATGKLYFEGNTVVEGNKYSDDLTARDVLMQVDGVQTINTTAKGLDLGAKIGVYVPDKDQNGNPDQFSKHGLESMPFGTWGKKDDLLGCFFNDRDDNLFGYQLSASDKNIYWGPYLCKITDAAGNTLKRANGSDAVYQRLSVALDEFTTVKDANGETGKAVYIKMLVEDYAIRQTDAISNFPAANITLTTASRSDASHPYRGTEGSVCTIYRTNSTNQLFKLNNTNTSFQLENITLDGRSDKSATAGSHRLIEAVNGNLAINGGTTMQYGSAENGGAIYASANAVVTVNKSENTAAESVKFLNCAATGSGGAIYADKLTILDGGSAKNGTLFRNCTAPNGGAISSSGNELKVAGAAFQNCHSTVEGGAVNHSNAAADARATIENSSFTSCYANQDSGNSNGGAVASNAGTLTVNSCDFNACYTKTDGGAINHTGVTTTITDTTFTACSTAVGFGGSVYSAAKEVALNGGSFQNSTSANHGGALYCASSADDSTATVSGTSFENCSTTLEDGAGGAIYSKTKALTLQDYTPAGSTVTTGTIINNCKAPKYSGAVHMETDSRTLNITGSTSISRCYAKEGAAIYLKPTVIMNLSGSAAFTKNGFTTSGQTVTEGACIYLAEGSLLNISGKLAFSENCPDPNRRVNNGGENILVRQDIYIAGYENTDATSLHIQGELTGDTIWIWAQYPKHQQPETGSNQFATTEDSGTVSASSLEKLRNAHDAEDTSCLNSDYLTGVRLVTDTTGTLVYWNRVYEVSFMKKDNKNYPVVGAEFVIYTDENFNVEVARAKSADGVRDKDARGLILEEGVVDFTAVPIGIYYMKELSHKSYKPNTTTYLMLVGTPTLILDKYNELWTSGPLNVPNAKTIVAENTPNSYGLYELGADGKAILDTNLTLPGKYIVNERLDYPVSFMKLDGEGVALPNANFTIYEAYEPVQVMDEEGNPVLDEEGSPVLRPALDENGFPRLRLWEHGDEIVTSTSADGTSKYRDLNNKTLKKGVVYFREIPKGTWYLRETYYPSRNGNNRISFYVEADRIFRLEVLGEEGIELYEWDSGNQTAYTDKLLYKSGDYYQVRNINAVCKLTNGETLLYERSLDGETLHPAVYASLEEGFAAAQTKSFYDVDGNGVSVLDDLKLQALKDFTISEQINYYNADRPLTFTTASRTASSTDRYVFTTTRTTDTSRALISRAYDESDVNDGAVIKLENVASLTLQNIILDGHNRNGRAIRVRSTGNGNTGEGTFNLTIGTHVQFQNFKVESDVFSELKGGAILMENGTSLTVNGGLNRTAIFSNNTVVNNKSNNSAEGGAIALETGADVLISYARFEGNTATASGGESFGGAVSVGNSTELTIDKVGFFGNTATNGGAVSVTKSGTVTLESGSFETNKAINGGVMYLAGGTTAVFHSGSFISNTATANGGAVWVGGSGTLSMSGVTISDNKAATGSAIYAENGVDAEHTTNVTITNASITGNTASGTNGGAINVGGQYARLYFGGTPTVFDNFGAQGENQQMNLVLNENSNEVINTTEGGLEDGVIGVFVIESDQPVFENHGLPGKPFGTFGDTATRLKPQVFRSDHALSLYGVPYTEVKDSAGENLIYWVDVICKLTDDNNKILYQDIKLKINGKEETRKAQAVYARITDYGNTGAVANGFNALRDGFDAAQDKLFVRDENKNPYAFNTYENTTVKLKMLKDYDLDKSILYQGSLYQYNRMVTFTTAETSDTRKDWGDYFTFNTQRSDADGKALIKRDFGDDRSMVMDKGARLTLIDIILDGNWHNLTVNGGIVYVENDAALTITNGATLQNAETTGNGGAVYVSTNATATVSGGTINGNTAANGAGIYLAWANADEHAILNLSGDPSFGGTDRKGGNGTDKDDLKGTEGNFVLKDSSFKTEDKEPTNGGKTYQKNGAGYYLVRQDIYIEGYEATSDDDTSAASLVVDGNITSGNGTIWVWANKSPRYKTLCQFAKYTADVTDTAKTFAAFRNAQDDKTTEADQVGEYLYGITKAEDTGRNVFWKGISGYDVKLKKVDSFGNALKDAVFTLYTDQNCKTALEVSGIVVTGTSDTNGVVFFNNRVPVGVYYMKETTIPSGYSNISKYIVLVGDRALTKEDLDTTETGYLEDITISTITDQTKLYKAAYKDEESDYDKYAVFLIDSTTSKAVVTPDIAKYGIMNTPEAERKVILRKVNGSFNPANATFEILRYDRSQVSADINGTPTVSFTSGASGVFFIGNLPYGTYYLHETAPSSKWFILTVNEKGYGYELADKSIISTLNAETNAP